MLVVPIKTLVEVASGYKLKDDKVQFDELGASTKLKPLAGYRFPHFN